MCLGVPVQVISVEPGVAVCRDGTAERRTNTLLLDAAPAAGDWVLVHIDTVIRAIDAEEARLVRDALRAVAAAAEGAPFEHLLADLIEREPTLPPHLRQATKKEETADGDLGH